MKTANSTRSMSLQSSALVLLAGMSTALVVVDAQNMLQSAVKKFHVTHTHHRIASPHRLSVEYQMQGDPAVQRLVTCKLWFG